MNFNYKVDNDVLFVFPQGRLDTAASTEFDAAVEEISKANPHSGLVLDASEIEYIASSGLRSVLKLAKTEKN